MLATHSYKKNPNGPVGNELDLKEGDTLVYLMEHDDNDSWWLAEDVKGHVACAIGISHDHLRRDSTSRGKRERRTR